MRRSPPVRISRSGSGANDSARCRAMSSSVRLPAPSRCAHLRRATRGLRDVPAAAVVGADRQVQLGCSVRSSAPTRRSGGAAPRRRPTRRPTTRMRTPISTSLLTSRRSALTKSFISVETSSSGRRQFSELNAKSVRYSTPRSPHACSDARTASTPRVCPNTRGLPRAFAQRPLPSMMIATCRGTGGAGTIDGSRGSTGHERGRAVGGTGESTLGSRMCDPGVNGP